MTALLPSISLIIPTYTEPERLQATLRSLSTQEYPVAMVEVVVVDDGSPHLEAERLHQAAAPLRLVLVRHATNQGRARARNSGLGAATGELVVFLDSDMTVAPGFLLAHAAVHRGHTDHVAIGNIRFPPEVATSAVSRYMETRGVHRIPAGQPVPFKCFVTGNSSLPRILLARAGWFDEGFREYGGEDLELGYRLHRAGATFAFAGEAISWHHHVRSLANTCRLMEAYGKGSLPLLLSKHPELAGLLRLAFLSARGWAPRALLLRIACWGGVYWPVRFLAVGLDRWWLPALVIDYLWWRCRSVAYRRATAGPAALGADHQRPPLCP